MIPRFVCSNDYDQNRFLTERSCKFAFKYYYYQRKVANSSIELTLITTLTIRFLFMMYVGKLFALLFGTSNHINLQASYTSGFFNLKICIPLGLLFFSFTHPIDVVLIDLSFKMQWFMCKPTRYLICCIGFLLFYLVRFFSQGILEHVTVLIGVAVNGRAVGGVICQPFYIPDLKHPMEEGMERHPKPEETKPRLIWGLEGLGLFGMNNEPLAHEPLFHKDSTGPSDTNDNVILSTRSHPKPSVTEAINACLPSKV